MTLSAVAAGLLDRGFGQAKDGLVLSAIPLDAGPVRSGRVATVTSESPARLPLWRFPAPPDHAANRMADEVGLGIEGPECVPDQAVGIVFDAVMVIDAFREFSYSESTGCAEPCP